MTCSALRRHHIKPKMFVQTDIDDVIIGHTKAPAEFTEALRDRTIKIDIP